MRKLKYHEQKLLKHVNFYDWKRTDAKRENKIIRRYRIQDNEDYHKYNKLVGLITKLTSKLRLLPSDDEFRIKVTDDLLKKLYDMGLISKKGNLELCEKLSASCFCRRRLAVVLVELKFCQNLEQATTYIEQGHITIGNQVINNPAYHISRTLEDSIKWTPGSKILEHIVDFHDNRDDYQLLNP